jgi:hypothetical protein
MCKDIRQQSMHFDNTFELAGAHTTARLFYARLVSSRLRAISLALRAPELSWEVCATALSLSKAGLIHKLCSDHHSSLAQPRLWHLTQFSLLEAKNHPRVDRYLYPCSKPCVRKSPTSRSISLLVSMSNSTRYLTVLPGTRSMVTLLHVRSCEQG